MFAPVETGLADHHVLILETIERVITGELPRAMFFLPPGSAKSTYGSVVAPTWAMGKYPGIKIILSSYGSDLARKHGRRARQIARSMTFRSVFQTTISSETAAADEWALTNGSEYLACGILSGITGNRANGIIVDDPIKGRQEADSDTVRARTWDVYQEDLRTRLIPGGWEIIISTRWHEDDLSGRILPDNYDGETGLIRCKDGRDWYIVCIPAQAERVDDPLGRKVGEYLWPEWFSEKHFEPFKVNSRTWNALFQQRPQPEQGTFFQREWFHRYEPIQYPALVHYYGSSDYAVTEEEQADFTEHGIIALDHVSDIWIKDWWRGQTESVKWIERQIDLIARYKPFCWFGEKGVIKRALHPYIRKRMQERDTYCRMEFIAPIKDKPTRARALQARAASGKVHLPVGPMGDMILDHLLKFPTGKKYDHTVDVLSLFCLALDDAHPAILPVLPPIFRKTLAEARVEHVEKLQRQDAEEAYLQHDRRLQEGYENRPEGPEYFYDVG
jgi:predicted phage terminase large subunit-like protein